VIGGFSVIKEGLNYSLINNNLTAKIVIQSGNDKYLRIGGRENTLISMRIDGANDGLANNGIFIQSYGSGNKCIELIANGGSEYAIKSHGPH
ncbi:hypothetical protein O4H25_13915, partial [Staphylococcus equorum]|uniref:hypothetical protein n=1 Tax=Staphylococcus equorum TaxID=246432 RepID=UPI0022AEB28E